MALLDYTKYFQDKARFHNDYLGDFSIHCREAGSVLVPSGGIVACDPLVNPETPSFTVQVPPGRYPIVLSLARMDSGDERVALAMLRVSSQAPRRWEAAVLPGQDPGKLGEDEFYGYGVDAGLGCFMSSEASQALVGKMQEHEDYFEEILEAVEKNYIHTRNWVEWPLDESSGLNMVIFSSGMGDGAYGSYWGYDEAGQVACLVTDFGLLFDGSGT